MKKICIGLIIIIIIFNIICIMNLNNKKEVIEENINEFLSISTYNELNNDRYYLYKENNNNLSNEEIVKNVNLNLDYDFYEHISNALNEHTNLVLVNKYYCLSSDYTPSNLVNIGIPYAINNNITGEYEAVNNFYNLYNDAYNLNLNIKVISAYRSYEYQYNLYNGYLKEDPVDIVDTYSARAGHSEHQTGLAFDVYNISSSYTDFGDTEEYNWLKDNAHLYGFIIRYKENEEYITGYKYEPWHIRYVGIDVATYIYENNITLEEYILNKKRTD